MGWFDKKYCDICGEKIGLLGNRKLEDGNLCKECAKKLSPWFDERRHSTVEQIKEQLAYREENKAQVARFHTTRSFGRGYILCLDEDCRKFLVARTRDIQTENPDVLDYSQVTGCDLDIDESSSEEMREIQKANGETEEVSYCPPRYTYSYDFYMIIRVNAPYFDTIRFKLNYANVEIESREMNGGHLGMAQTADPRMRNPDYAEFYNMGMEIKEALTSIRAQVRQEIDQAAAPKAAVTCPWCGATTTADASGCCEYCGGSLNG